MPASPSCLATTSSNRSARSSLGSTCRPTCRLIGRCRRGGRNLLASSRRKQCESRDLYAAALPLEGSGRRLLSHSHQGLWSPPRAEPVIGPAGPVGLAGTTKERYRLTPSPAPPADPRSDRRDVRGRPRTG